MEHLLFALGVFVSALVWDYVSGRIITNQHNARMYAIRWERTQAMQAQKQLLKDMEWEIQRDMRQNKTLQKELKKLNKQQLAQLMDELLKKES